jgi:hypothetical protein
VPGSRSSTGARSRYRLAPGPSRCLPGGPFVSPPRRSQADAARAASPPRPARAAQPYRPLCSRAGRSIADGDMVGLRLMNQPGPCAGRLAFVSARDAQTARAWPWPVSAWWTPVRSPPGRSQADAARAASPPYPARAAQTVYMVWVSTSFGWPRRGAWPRFAPAAFASSSPGSSPQSMETAPATGDPPPARPRPDSSWRWPERSGIEPEMPLLRPGASTIPPACDSASWRRRHRERGQAA